MRFVAGPGSLPAPTSGDPAPAPEEHEVPFDLPEPDRYVRDTLIAVGGMGRVYAATDRRLGRQVAFKELNLRGDEAEGALLRLVREAWVTARLDHPAIVPVHDAGRMPDGTLFYTMRLVRGRTLHDALHAAPDAEARLRLVRPLLDACRAVAFAHDQGYVHRDLKPANILLGAFGETQVADWGVARHVGEADPSLPPQPTPSGHTPDRALLTRFGAVVGTPGYMSPEQAAAAPPAPTADVWSLGAILHTLLTGVPPQDRNTWPDDPPELWAITRRALHPEPAQRYPDAGALAEELDAWFAGRRVAAYTYRPQDLLRRLLLAWRGPLMVGAAALVLLALVIVLAVAQTRAEADRARAAESAATAARERSDHHLARVLTAQARAEADRGAWADAAWLAAEAGARAPTPDTVGLLMEAMAAPSWRREALGPLPTCDRVIPGRARRLLLCLRDHALTAIALDGPGPVARWTADGVTDAGFAGPDQIAALTLTGEMVLLDAATGAVRASATATPQLQVTSQERLALGVFTAGPFITWMRDGVVEVLPCEGSAVQATDVGPADLAVVCGDGALHTLRPTDAPPRAAGVPDGRREDVSALVRGTPGERWFGSFRGDVWREYNGREVWRVSPALGRVHDLVPVGDLLVVRGDEGGITVLAQADGAVRGRLPGRVRGPFVARDTADGLTLDTFGGRHERWTLPRGTVQRARVEGSLTAVHPAADGGWWISVSDGRVLRASPGGPELTQLAQVGRVLKAAVPSPDGAWVAAPVSAPGPLTLLDTTGRHPPRTIGHAAAMRRAGWFDAQHGWVTTSSAEVVRFTVDGAFVAQRFGEDPIGDVATLPDRLRVLTRAGSVYDVPHAAGHPVDHLPGLPGAAAIAAHSADRWALVHRHALHLHTPAGVRVVPMPDAELVRGTFDPAGRWLAVGTAIGELLIIEVDTGTLLARARPHQERAAWSAWTLDGIASVSWDGTFARLSSEALTGDPAALAESWREAWDLSLADDLGPAGAAPGVRPP